jgi:hypothetical protein
MRTRQRRESEPPKRGRRGRCADCKTPVVYLKLDTDKYTPPFELTGISSDKWVPHVCAFSSRRRENEPPSRWRRCMDGCSVHEIRRHDSHGYAAYARKTGRLIPSGTLDAICVRKLRELRQLG